MTPLTLTIAALGFLCGFGAFFTYWNDRDFPWSNVLPTFFLLILVCMGFYQLVWH